MIGVEAVGHKRQPRGQIWGAKDIASFTSGTKQLLPTPPKPKWRKPKIIRAEKIQANSQKLPVISFDLNRRSKRAKGHQRDLW
jgi:hypothetical protein